MVSSVLLRRMNGAVIEPMLSGEVFVSAVGDMQVQTSVATLTFPVPDGTAVGDLIVGCVMARPSLSVPPPGFLKVSETDAENGSNGSTYQKTYVYTKTAESGDIGGFVVFKQATEGRMIGQVFSVRCEAGTPVPYAASEGGFSSEFGVYTVQIPSATAAKAGALGFAMCSTVLSNSDALVSVTVSAGWSLISPARVLGNRVALAEIPVGAGDTLSGEFAFAVTGSPANNGMTSNSVVFQAPDL